MLLCFDFCFVLVGLRHVWVFVLFNRVGLGLCMFEFDLQVLDFCFIMWFVLLFSWLFGFVVLLLVCLIYVYFIEVIWLVWFCGEMLCVLALFWVLFDYVVVLLVWFTGVQIYVCFGFVFVICLLDWFCFDGVFLLLMVLFYRICFEALIRCVVLLVWCICFAV